MNARKIFDKATNTKQQYPCIHVYGICTTVIGFDITNVNIYWFCVFNSKKFFFFSIHTPNKFFTLNSNFIVNTYFALKITLVLEKTNLRAA